MKGDFIHHNHGDAMHNLAIMVGKSICAGRGYQFLNPDPLKAKAIYPGEPDIYVRIFGAHGQYKNYVIEIETTPTKASIDKKTKQFSGDGLHELIIVDMRKLIKRKDWKNITVGELITFLELWVP